MADDKTKRGGRGRAKVTGGEGYEVNYFAQKQRLTRAEARQLIAEVGNTREELNAAAAKLNRSRQR